MNKFKVYIPSDLCDITGVELAHYAATYYFCKTLMPCHDEVRVTSVMLYDLFYGIDNYNRNQTKYFHQVFDKFISEGIMNGRSYNNAYIINKDSFKDPGKFVASVYIEDIIKIISSKSKYNYNVIKHYVLVMASRSSKSGYTKCNMPATYFAEKIGCTLPTIYKYNEFLEDLGILSVDHSKYGWNNIYTYIG